MSFSALTCITFTGTTPLGPTIYFYSDYDGFTDSFGNAPLSSLVGENCPYTITGIPDGTVVIKFRDPTTTCCAEITITPTLDLCVFCNFGFNDYETTTISEIVAGDLTSTCDTNITDYLVNWYGPGAGSTNVQFTSGKGSQFSYNWTHPLTGSSSVFVPPGIYIPIVESVIINGTAMYDDLGATATCFEPVTVESYNCSNGNTAQYNYTHVLEFTNQSQGSTPPNISSEFILSSNTNYFAYAFRAETQYDILKITYIGSAYAQPLVIENLLLGSINTASNFSPDSFPKSGNSTGWFTKVLCLTGITYSSGDKLIIEIEPNPDNTNTNWSLYFKCLETFNCDKCFDTLTPYKIIKSSITGITGSCDVISIQLKISGCTFEENEDSDILKYYTNNLNTSNGFSSAFATTTNSGGSLYSTQNLYHSSISCQIPTLYYENTMCYTTGVSDIYYRSYRPNGTTRIIEIKFEDNTDFNSYVSSFYEGIIYSGSTNPLSLDYYRRFLLDIPTPDGNTECGDNTIINTFSLHPSTLIFESGTTVDPPFSYFINITATTITNQIISPVCYLNCNSYIDNVIVNTINQTVTGSSFDFTGTTTASSRRTIPFWLLQGITDTTTSVLSGQFLGYLNIPEYYNVTYVATGNPLTNITTMSAETCSLTPTMTTYIDYLYQYVYYYKAELTNPSDVRDFRIYASPITNGVYSGFPSTTNFTDFVYGFSAGTEYYFNPTYVI